MSKNDSDSNYYQVVYSVLTGEVYQEYIDMAKIPELTAFLALDSISDNSKKRIRKRIEYLQRSQELNEEAEELFK